ncbi:MAG: 2OG-Fe(II) oxygenase family protein [Parasphingorhabdus sp.]
MVGVPTIDLHNLNDNSLLELDRACVDHGFFQLVGHGIDDLIDDIHHQAEMFFDAPRDIKTAILRPKHSPFGYFDRELTKGKRDKKEVFDYHGKPIDDTVIDSVEIFDFWPKNDKGQLEAAGLSGFQAALTKFYAENTALAERVVALMCSVMNGEAEKVAPLFDKDHSSLARLNHYPHYDPLPQQDRDEEHMLGDLALGQHTDPSAITLLYQDESGGLQTESDEDGWIDVPPVKHSFVVNVGDLMQAFSNNRYKAANHRVLPVKNGVSRFSFPYFYFPKPGAIIETVVRDEEPVYRSFKIGELLNARMEDNYEYSGEADTQLSNFLIAA